MKNSTIIIAVGVIAVGIVVVYKCLKKNSAQESERFDDNTNVSGNKTQKPDENIIKYDLRDNVDDVIDSLSQEKEDIQNNIMQRHKAAAEIMKESMENIIAESNVDMASENAQDFEEIDDALDDLLDE